MGGTGYKIVEIRPATDDNGGGRVLGLLCGEWNRAGSNLAVHFNVFFFPCRILSKFWQFTFIIQLRIIMAFYAMNLISRWALNDIHGENSSIIVSVVNVHVVAL